MIINKTIFLSVLILLLGGSIFRTKAQQRIQQRVDHYLDIELDDVRNVITGSDSLVYYNQSSDTIRYIYFHLWPEGIRPGSPLSDHLLAHGDGSLNFAGQSETGSMSGVVFRVNGKGLRWEYHNNYSEVCRVDLPNPILPFSHIVINIMFRLQVPAIPVVDLSHDRQAYFLAHWFPRPAVYNEHGWQIMPVHQQGRLLGEFGNFSIELTLPRNYVVATSGVGQEDPDEDKFRQNLFEKTRKTNRWGKRENAGFPASVAKTKTLRFYRNNASDFAICLDKRLRYLQDTLITTNENGDSLSILLNLYFTVFEAEYWSNAIPILKNAMRYMINYAGRYPYESISIVQTSWLKGSRAYPGMIRIGSMMSPYLLEQAIIYGLADHWFNTSISVDHYRNPWLCRGLPEYLTVDYLRKLYPDSISLQDLLLDPGVKINVAGLRNIPFYRLGYYRMGFLKTDDQLPPILKADEFSPRSYSVFAEQKSALAFSTLAGSLGDDLFRTLLKTYYRENTGKITSSDAINSLIVSIAGEETTEWFTDELLKQPVMPDYRVSSVKKTSDGFRLLIKNTAGVTTPYPVTRVTPCGDTTYWFSGHKDEIVVHIQDTGHITKKFIIDKEFLTPEIRRNNNSIRTHGLFRKTETLRVAPFVTTPNPYQTQFIISPVAGWNSSNGFMAGLASYSNPVIKPETEYLVMPLYGFRNGHMAGTARILHNIKTINNKISKIVLGAEIKRYGLQNTNNSLSWNRLMPFIELHFKPSGKPGKGRQMIRFRSVMIGKDTEVKKPADSSSYLPGEMQRYVMNEIMWRHRVSGIINPFNLQVSLQQCGSMLRLISENNFLFSYPQQGKGFSLRVFGGLMILNSENNSIADTRFSTSGVAMNTNKMYAFHDPWFDNLYLARNDVNGLLRQHMYINDGGFKRLTTVGNNKKWMVTANLSTTLPGWIPFDLWLDAGLFGDDSKKKFFDSQFLFSAGVKVSIIRNVAEIYFPFPFAESKAIADREDLNNLDLKYLNKIRFVLNLHHLNPLTLPSKIRIK